MTPGCVSKPCRAERWGRGVGIKAEVPLAEMFGYATDLRSATQGRATYTMEFEKYSEAPASVSELIVNRGH